MSKRKESDSRTEIGECNKLSDYDTVPVNKKIKVESRKKRAGITQEIYNETSYQIRNGLRYVKPYYFTFTTHAKGRWVGSKVIDIFCREFQSESPEYYEKAIKAGKVTVNGKVAALKTVVKDNELITHRVHRHEPPVIATPLSIVHKDEDFVVVNKPASMPVHPCGRYRHNSVIFLLAKEHQMLNLHPVHRLDRLTSGLLMFARSVSKAQDMERQIRGRKISKIYLCRVQGEFPSDPVVCNEPILVVTHKVGVCRVDPLGKECSTIFTRLSYNGSTSVVKCEPKTGRMHQIRVHLQWLGHPIVNDPIYNHPAWKQHPLSSDTHDQTNIEKIISEIVRTNYSSQDNSRSKSTGTSVDPKSMCTPNILPVETTETENDHALSTSNEHTTEAKLPTLVSTTPSPASGKSSEMCEVSNSGMDMVASAEQIGASSSSAEPPVVAGLCRSDDLDPDCSECALERSDPSPSHLLMYLHALSYKGEGWEFSTSPPEWAHADWKK